MQISAQSVQDKPRIFFSGISVDYMSLSPELDSYSSQNWIDGQNFGWTDWTSDEINEFNEFIETKQYWLSTGLTFGAWLYHPVDKPFSIKVLGQAGYPIFKHSEKQKNNGDLSFEGRQKGMAFFGGLTLDFEYRFQKWGLILRPSFNYLRLSTDKVSYNYLEEGSYSTEYDFMTTSLFYCMDLMASYQVKNIQLYAGPGYDQYNNQIDLTIKKESSSQSFQDDIKQEFRTQNNLGAVIGFNWELFQHFLWSSHARLGADIGFETSFLYQF